MAKKLRDYGLYLEDILESIKKIRNYTKGMSFAEFAKDEKTIDAVVRNFEIMGEASKQLPQEIKNKHSEIEWKAMIDFRNVIIHEYFGIDLKIMWDIIKNELPPLARKLKRLRQVFKNKKISHLD
uniref:DUF86 domain-containing protein n=1 Tax=candidate division WOR-3 bacterium TaxID=2052148 RepID=A0A7C6EBF6_UNCW3